VSSRAVHDDIELPEATVTGGAGLHGTELQALLIAPTALHRLLFRRGNKLAIIVVRQTHGIYGMIMMRWRWSVVVLLRPT